MRITRRFVTFAILLPLGLLLFSPVQSWALRQARRIAVLVGLQNDGSAITPIEQVLRSTGVEITFAGRPMDLALSPDGKTLAVLNFKSLTLLDLKRNAMRQDIPVKGGHPFVGILWTGSTIYTSRVGGTIQTYDDSVSEAKASVTIPLPIPKDLPAELNDEDLLARGNKPVRGTSLPAGMMIDGRMLYVVLNRANSLAAIDLTRPNAAARQVPTGIAPYTVAANNGKLYVTNWGGRRPKIKDTFAPSGGSQVVVDPETGIASTGTVTVVDLKTFKAVKELDVGLHPSAMAVHPSSPLLYVANANSDTVSILNTETDTVAATASVKSDGRLPFGSAPNALAVSRDGSRLYVANGGNNCVAVFSLLTPTKPALLGLIPTSWYPGAVLLTPDNKTLIVANVKGRGSLATTGRVKGKGKDDRKAHGVKEYLGSVSVIPVPSDAQLPALTREVYANNHWDAILNPAAASAPSLPPIKHVIYIIKENRTYDQVLGDMPQGNGDESLCQFPLRVTPNHHALAEQFVLLDNFYCSGVCSADGHQWTNEAYVVDYLEKSFGDFARSYPYAGTDPLAYASSGFLWDNALRHGKTFRDYGEFGVPSIKPADATWSDCYNDRKSDQGKIKYDNRADIAPLNRWMCHEYPAFNLKVSDQIRADIFLRELHQFEKNGALPNLTILLLPCDHTSGTKPGLPTPEASVADNDLALGRIVEAVSKSRFWKETAIFVVEDDAQAGVDHVDGHRTVAFCISPYTRRGVVESTLYTQVSMVRTIELVLNLPPMNQLDLAATPMLNCFTDKPDFTPYTALPTQIPLDTLNPPLKALRGQALRSAQQSLAQNFEVPDAADEQVLNRIIWHSIKGYDTPYPAVNEEEDDD